jgi:hypothetical protein
LPYGNRLGVFASIAVDFFVCAAKILFSFDEKTCLSIKKCVIRRIKKYLQKISSYDIALSIYNKIANFVTGWQRGKVFSPPQQLCD